VSGALTGSGASDLEPAWQAGLALAAYAGVLGALAAALTERRDVP
jgi:predicted outer membrane lipoprotein